MTVHGGITAYLHVGNDYVRQPFPKMPIVGDVIEVVGYGEMTVVRVDYNSDGDAHVYMEARDLVDGVL